MRKLSPHKRQFFIETNEVELKFFTVAKTEK